MKNMDNKAVGFLGLCPGEMRLTYCVGDAVVKGFCLAKKRMIPL